MPGIQLTLSGAADAARTAKLVPLVGGIVDTYLDKNPERTWVVVRHVPREDWFIANRSLVDHGRNAFRLEVTVTDETTTTTQKAAFAREAFARIAEVIGNVHPHSNIHVIDCRATSYSYGGITQEQYLMQKTLEAAS